MKGGSLPYESWRLSVGLWGAARAERSPAEATGLWGRPSAPKLQL